MKNQYFADRRDFFKYDLLLRLMGCGLGFERLVMAWWLTADDESGDGEVRDYTAGGRDRALHDWLQLQHHRARRDVGHLTECPSFRDAPWEYLPILDTVPDDPEARAEYVLTVEAAARVSSLVFLDPDNGMMVRSATWSRRCKYVAYPEVGRIAGATHDESLLVVYQHLPRAKREVYYPAALELLRSESGVEHVTWVSPDNLVAYFLITRRAGHLEQVQRALATYLATNGFHLQAPRDR